MYYVYQLIDPRDNSVFYVGKGKGNRKDMHVLEARKGGVGAKCDRIREILKARKKILAAEVQSFATEEAAYLYEKELIASIGIENLTNVKPGGGTPRISTEEKKRRHSIDVLALLLRSVSKPRPSTLWAFALWQAAKKRVPEFYAELSDKYGERSLLDALREKNIMIENRS